MMIKKILIAVTILLIAFTIAVLIAGAVSLKKSDETIERIDAFIAEYER